MKNLTRCFSLDVAGRVDVLQARYYGRAFSPHWHEEYAIGLITGGVEQFEYRGATHCAGPGEIVLMDAGEIHTGESWDERGFAFRMLYIPESTFREAAAGKTLSRTSQHLLPFSGRVTTYGITSLRTYRWTGSLRFQDRVSSISCGSSEQHSDYLRTLTSCSNGSYAPRAS